jgi:hypothetical protein
MRRSWWRCVGKDIRISALGLGAADALAQRGPAQMQERFERMEQMMERMPQAGTRAERRQIMREHHQEMRAQMEELRGMRGRGPQADPEERLRFMEQRHETMQEMMRQMLPAGAAARKRVAPARRRRPRSSAPAGHVAVGRLTNK